jgi:hypothetical protein
VAGRSVAASLTQLAGRLDEFEQAAVGQAGDVIVDELRRAVKQATGGDGALSGIRGGRYKIDVETKPLRAPAGVRITPGKKQAGMWALVETGRSSYTAAARPRRKHKAKATKTSRNSSRYKAMSVDGAWRAGPWPVGGTSGRHAWSRGRDAGMARAVDVLNGAFHRVVSGG